MAFFVAEQPRRPYGRSMAKSKALVIDMAHKGYSSIETFCTGLKGHYEPQTGLCVHIVYLLAHYKSQWHRSRAWYLPFGDADHAKRRVMEELPKTNWTLTKRPDLDVVSDRQSVVDSGL